MTHMSIAMAVTLDRRVDYPMIDNANIAYYPRIYDLAHRFFEEAWELMCDISYPEIIEQHRLGFPVVICYNRFYPSVALWRYCNRQDQHRQYRQ